MMRSAKTTLPMRLKLGKTGAHPELADIGERWRQQNPLLRLDSYARVIFLIPLISRNRSTSWERVDENLALTLKSLIAQSNPNWEAWICGQDAPQCASVDPRIRFIQYAENIPPNQISDKGPKMKLLRQRLFEAPPGDGYLFYLDADDILHPGLVEYFLSRADTSGYLIRSGYIMDYSTGQLGAFGRKTARHWRRRPFFLHCGSCSAIRVDRRSGRSFEAVLEERGKHGQQRERLAYFGFELAEVPFPAAIYMVNHGENLRLRRGKLDAKLRYLRKNILRPEEATSVLEEFGFERLRHGSS